MHSDITRGKANVVQIIIYSNYSKLLGEEETEERINEIADYVPVYRAIVEAWCQNESLTVSIEREARVCEAWLKRMAEQRGERYFAFIDVTPRSRLAEQWNVEVPTWVSDRAIQQAGLLNEPVSGRPGESFQDAVLRHFYSPHLTHPPAPDASDRRSVERPQGRPLDKHKWNEASAASLPASIGSLDGHCQE